MNEKASIKKYVLTKVSSVIWIIFATASIIRHIKNGDSFLLWSGIIIGALHLGALLYWLLIKRSNLD
jgi:membrane protein implicated in regulation of membrane protease activity